VVDYMRFRIVGTLPQLGLRLAGGQFQAVWTMESRR
jgi:hypothetical protein